MKHLALVLVVILSLGLATNRSLASSPGAAVPAQSAASFATAGGARPGVGPGFRSTAMLGVLSRIRTLALDTSGAIDLAVNKNVCSSATSCNDISQVNQTTTFTLYDCSTGTCANGQAMTGTSLGSGTVLIGTNGNSAGSATFTNALAKNS